MKVLHAIWSARFGGIEQLVLDLAAAQRRQGIDAAILLCRPGGELASVFTERRVPVEEAHLRNGWDFSPTQVWRLIGIMQRYDIIQIHSYNPIVCQSAAMSGSSVIFSDHGTPSMWRNPSLREQVKHTLQRSFLNRQVDFITFNSQFTADFTTAYFRLGKVRREVVYNGIDLRRATTGPTTVGNSLSLRLDGRFVVGTCSRFAELKRIDRLIRAFAEFSVAKTAALLLVGDGPMRESYEQLVKNLGIAPNTIFAGYQPEPHSFQQQMNVCVIPSEIETFGLAAVEALSLGKPVIAMANAGGIAEIIGLLEPNDLVKNNAAIVSRLDHYYKNWKPVADSDDVYHRRIAFASKFDITRMATQMSTVYSHIR